MPVAEALRLAEVLRIAGGTPPAAALEASCFLDVGDPPLPEPEPDIPVLLATPFPTKADGGGGATLLEADDGGGATILEADGGGGAALPVTPDVAPAVGSGVCGAGPTMPVAEALRLAEVLRIAGGTPPAAALEASCFLDVGDPPLPEPEPDIPVLLATPFPTKADGGGGATLLEADDGGGATLLEADGGGGATLLEADGGGGATLFEETNGKNGEGGVVVLAATLTKEGTMGFETFLTAEE